MNDFIFNPIVMILKQPGKEKQKWQRKGLRIERENHIV